jgi:hypothetical protein
MIEELKYSDTLSIWRIKYQMKDQETIIKDCYKIISGYPKIKRDAFLFYESTYQTMDYFNEVTNNELDEIRNFGINSCVDLYNKRNYEEIVTDTWINIVRINPTQINVNGGGELIFHNHSDLNKKIGRVIPNYTFVVYIQIPNNLSGEDGVLYFKDVDGRIYHYLPENGDCVIMGGDVPHVPEYAKKSTLDRLVLAGNVTFQTKKKEKTLF